MEHVKHIKCLNFYIQNFSHRCQRTLRLNSYSTALHGDRNMKVSSDRCDEKDDQLSMHQRYQLAVERLNGLQSNAATLSKVIARGQRAQSTNVEDMCRRLRRCGLEAGDLTKLNVIHVSGTKGKGSTCAYAESLLRHRGFKTGFFSSPHLVEVRERIRINGQPLSKEKFVEHFWTVFNKLDRTRAEEGDAMPPYFSFLTLLGFHVFLAEAVDVALLEVGIGGRFDCTNCIEAPVVCGISSLGHDHMSILGDTLTEIAWNKAGIIKNSCQAVITCQQQPEEALSVLRQEAANLKKELFCAPPLEDYPLPSSFGSPVLGIGGSVQKLNASLALQLTEMWRQWRLGQEEICFQPGQPFPLDEQHLTALANTRWYGRCSVIERPPNVRLHLDGAHTPESITFCANWFAEVSKSPRLLVFNVLGQRDALSMLKVLLPLNFDFVIFCPNIVFADQADAPDVVQCAVSPRSQLEKCRRMLATWQELSSCPAAAVASVEETLAFVEKADTHLAGIFSSADRVDVLVTGSLHLVGDFFALLAPELSPQ